MCFPQKKNKNKRRRCQSHHKQYRNRGNAECKSLHSLTHLQSRCITEISHWEFITKFNTSADSCPAVTNYGRNFKRFPLQFHWTLRESNPGGARFSAAVQNVPGDQQASCRMGTGSFPGIKLPKSGVYHPPPTNAEVKERVVLYLYTSSRTSWIVPGWTLHFMKLYILNPSQINCNYVWIFKIPT